MNQWGVPAGRRDKEKRPPIPPTPATIAKKGQPEGQPEGVKQSGHRHTRPPSARSRSVLVLEGFVQVPLLVLDVPTPCRGQNVCQ